MGVDWDTRLAGLHQQLDRSKTRIARYWGDLNDDQRWAICSTASRRFGLTLSPDMVCQWPLTDPRWSASNKEALCHSVKALGYQGLFSHAITPQEWRDIPAKERAVTTPTVLANKLALLKACQAGNKKPA